MGIQGLAKLIKSLFSAIEKLSICLVFLMALIVFQQVIARYFFSSSSVALQELSWHLFGVLILFGGLSALRHDRHVRVDIFYQFFPRRLKKAIDILGWACIGIPFALLVCFYGYQFAEQAMHFQNPHPETWWRELILFGEISPDPGGLEGRWIIKFIIPLSMGLFFLQTIVKIFTYLKEK